MDTGTIFFIAATALGSLGLLNAAFATSRKRHKMTNLPTSKVKGVFVGQVELKGTAEIEAGAGKTAPFSKEPAVYYSISVDEECEKTRTVTKTDAKGKKYTATETYRDWENVYQQEVREPFYLRDETGAIRILPHKAKIHSKITMSETLGPADELYDSITPRQTIHQSCHRRRFMEYSIPLHHPLYLVGRSRIPEDAAQPEIAFDKNAPFYLISTQTEKQETSGFGWGILSALVLSIGLAWLCGICIAEGLGTSLSLFYPITLSSIVLGIGIIGYIIRVANSMIELHHSLQQADSNLGVELKRRYDLIPRLAEVVKGMKNHEAFVQESLAYLRSQAGTAPSAYKGQTILPVSRVAVGVLEKYPNLTADENFMNLQKEMVNTEDRIALSRNYYNDVLKNYNDRCQEFPTVLLAKLLALPAYPYLEAEGLEREGIAVQFEE